MYKCKNLYLERLHELSLLLQFLEIGQLDEPQPHVFFLFFDLRTTQATAITNITATMAYCMISLRFILADL
jgi:hypothetical protein